MNKTSLHSVDMLKQILELLSEYEIAAETFLALPELRDLSHSFEGAPGENESGQILLAAIKLSGDPHFCLRLGRRAKISNFGTLGFALMSCVNLREVLHLLVRYHPVLNLGPKWELTTIEGGAVLRTPTSFKHSDGHRAMMETAFSTLYAIGENLLDGPIEQIELQLNYTAPAHSDVYEKYFAMPVKFDQQACQAILVDHDLDRSLRTANPAGNVILREQCEDMLRSLNRTDNVSAAVRRILIHAGREFPDISAVSDQLGMGERTLRRRLKDEGSSFRTICDEVRNVLACQYLSTTQITIAEIAYLLGYSETVSFRRAFIRWNAQTPQQYRLE